MQTPSSDRSARRSPRFAAARWAAGVAAAWACAGCTDPRPVSDRNINRVELTELRGWLAANDREARAALVDPRAPEEFAKGHIPGARNLRLTQVRPELGKDRDLNEYDVIVVYGDNPSSSAAKAMAKQMYSNRWGKIYLFEGGLEAWREAGLPVEGPAAGADGPKE